MGVFSGYGLVSIWLGEALEGYEKTTDFFLQTSIGMICCDTICTYDFTSTETEDDTVGIWLYSSSDLLLWYIQTNMSLVALNW